LSGVWSICMGYMMEIKYFSVPDFDTGFVIHVRL
jgi:hypothetical protein